MTVEKTSRSALSAYKIVISGIIRIRYFATVTWLQGEPDMKTLPYRTINIIFEPTENWTAIRGSGTSYSASFQHQSKFMSIVSTGRVSIDSIKCSFHNFEQFSNFPEFLSRKLLKIAQ